MQRHDKSFTSIANLMNILELRNSALALLLAAGGACFAQSSNAPAGYVKNVTGAASVTSSGKTVKAQPGTPLLTGDIIRTEPDSSLGLTLKDNTLISFGPSTEFSLDAYLFAPAKGDLKLGGRIASLLTEDEPDINIDTFSDWEMAQQHIHSWKNLQRESL